MNVPSHGAEGVILDECTAIISSNGIGADVEARSASKCSWAFLHLHNMLHLSSHEGCDSERDLHLFQNWKATKSARGNPNIVSELHCRNSEHLYVRARKYIYIV